MEANRGLLPGEVVGDAAGSVLHEAQGQDDAVDGRDGMFFLAGSILVPSLPVLFDRLTHSAFVGDTGPEAPHGSTRLRERKVAHHCQQGRHGIHAGVLSRAGLGAGGGAVIAINVPAGGLGSWVWGHNVPSAATLKEGAGAFSRAVAGKLVTQLILFTRR